MTNPYGGTKKGWYRSADVPFSWREWVWISNSSKGIYKSKDKSAYVSCYVMRKPKSHQKEKTLAKKQVEWRYIQPKPSKVSEIKKLLDQPMKQSSEWDD
jgi:hypothetical protein